MNMLDMLRARRPAQAPFSAPTGAPLTEVPRVLFLGGWDWANLANRFARAMNDYAGANRVRVLTTHAHPFGYQEDLIVALPEVRADERLRDVAAQAEWVIATGDGVYDIFDELLRTLPFGRGVRRAVMHVGSAYREEPRKYDRLDDERGVRARFMAADLLRFAERDPRAVPYLAGCEVVGSLTDSFGPLRVCHSPSKRSMKGTEVILPVLERLANEGLFTIDLIEGVPAEEAVDRRRSAHIHVDQIMPTIGGYGQAAVEAMGVGCAALCDMRHISPHVARYFPLPPAIDIRDGAQLEAWLRRLAHDRELLHRMRSLALAWARASCTPEAVARYWLYHLGRLGG